MENQNNISVNDELIARYLAGEAGPEEAVALHEWMEFPANRNHFEGIRAAWHHALPSTKPGEINVAEAWSSVSRNMAETGASVKPAKFYLAIAASLTILISAGLWLFNTGEGARSNSVVLSTTDSARQIELSDNSAVILNRKSTLSYPESFSGHKREVKLLSGEGFFDVATNSDKPFIVITDLASIQVIGTAFNVIAENGRVQVGVKEGKVMVYTENDSVLVLPGFTAEITTGKNSIKMEAVADINDWGYATGLFVFKDTPFLQVISKIEKSFPCLIEAANPNINNCRLTATFENVSVENMLYLMAETLNLSVTRDGKMFTLRGEGCP